jgi:uncharacterized RDD family membrane protein YckC
LLQCPAETAALDCASPEISAPESAPEPEEDSSAWRQEVAARLNRYQSRRKPRPPRYPSLRLQFDGEAVGQNTHPDLLDSSAQVLALASNYGGSNRALALDAFDFAPQCAPDQSLSIKPGSLEAGSNEAEAPMENAPHPAAVTARILEFPRPDSSQSEFPQSDFLETGFPQYWTPPLPAPNQLAEPVFFGPRILEVPEFVPPAPALGGITIHPPPAPALEKRPGIDIPLQAAPFERRVLSAALDAALIALHCALFAFIFWKLTGLRPPRMQIAGVLAGLAAVLWAAFQYLLLVYAGTTPGLRLAKLQIVRFDGSPAPRKLRRWRVLASFLSALSLGMGYAWVFLDEDSLCWHDRITHTYLEGKKA